jgi:hypothetical protein
MKYPKINSLWKREGWYYDEAVKKNTPPSLQKNRQKFIEGDYACPEFANINNWLVTEKIDGMNIRIICKRETFDRPWNIEFRGRTDNAQLPPKLLAYLQEHFTSELIESVFGFDAHEIILYGEGYGEKIQSGGYYSKEQRFVLFDVKIGFWWFEFDNVIDSAQKLGVPHVPVLNLPRDDKKNIIEYVKARPYSKYAENTHISEGVVARAYPMVLFREGTPIKFKLKCKDFKDVD